jgi:uncharacterized protein (DUF111 family)
VIVIETNLDDLSPQVLAYTIERLLRGARPTSHGPDEKGRLCLLTVVHGREAARSLLMRETGTLGYRVRRTGRVVLKREQIEVGIEGGTVRVKTAALGGQQIRYAPEYEDCRRIAEKTGRPLREVIDDASRTRG